MPGKRVTQEERELWRQMRAKGISAMDISRLSGKSYGAVRRATNGVVPSQHASHDEIRRIKELKKNGWLNKHIAKEVGRSEACVERHTVGMTKIALTEEVKDRIRHLKKMGATAAAIAEIMGFAESTIHGITHGMRKATVRGGAVKGSKLTHDIVREVIVPWLQEGRSQRSIVRSLNELFRIKVDRSVIGRIRNRKAWVESTAGMLLSPRKINESQEGSSDDQGSCDRRRPDHADDKPTRNSSSRDRRPC